MADHGAEWYKRDPQAYLGGTVGMTAREHAVYSVILDLIYAHGGRCRNDAKWFAGWFSDMGPAAVRHAIEALVQRGKLQRDGDFLTNKRARAEAETREKLRENRRKTGKKGGVLSGISRRAIKENKDLREANASPREEKTIVKKEDTNVSSQKSRGTRIPNDWHCTAELRGFAESCGLNEFEIAFEADQFRDYWRSATGAKASKRDWAATWRNWIRRAAANPRRQKGSKDDKFSRLVTGGAEGRAEGERNVDQGEGAFDAWALPAARAIGS